MPGFASACRALAALCAVFVLRAEPVRVVIASPNNPALARAAREFESRYGGNLIDLVSCSPEITPEQIGDARAILFSYVNSPAFQRTAEVVRRAHRRGAVVVSLPSDSAETLWRIRTPAKLADKVAAYWRGGSVENLVGLLATLYKAGGGTKDLRITEPTEAVSLGIYHPDAGQPFGTLKEYLAWYRSRPGALSGAPLVGISFYSNTYKFGDLSHIDALVRAFERADTGVVPVFAGTLPDMAPLLDLDGHCPLRVLLALNLTMARSSHAGVLSARGLRTIHLNATRESFAEWSASPRGLAPERVALLYGAPERVGATEGILIGTTEKDPATGAGRTVPIPERMEALVNRVRKWIALADKPRVARRVALIYYNNPPGKGNFGASYLNVPASLAELLRILHENGYQTGGRGLGESDLLAVLELCGRNVGEWAPGEVEQLVTRGHATLLPVERYREWFARLPAAFRKAVNDKWGPPETSRMMTLRSGTRAFFVIPGVQLGHVFVGPQPFRSHPAGAAGGAHDSITPPPHSYVAWYLWLRHHFQTDAVVHVGRHGTLEWLPGKSVALAGSDPPEAVLGDLPNVYYYIMDGGGEAIQAKRRGAAVLISHRTPLMVTGGSRPELRNLDRLLQQEESAGGAELAASYRRRIVAAARSQKLDVQAGIDFDKDPWPQARERLEALLHDTENTPVPLGLPVLGVAQDETQQREALAEFLRSRFRPEEAPALGDAWLPWATAIAAGRQPEPPAGLAPALRDKLLSSWSEGRQWIDDLRRSPALERQALLDALDGRYLPTGILGDPLRQAGALPTGRNLHSFDAGLLPTKAAWETGQRMAGEYLARHLREKGAYPEKVSFVLWFGETMRHHGSFECMALWLLGVEPLWNARGQVDELRLVPDAQLKRPRVDVVFAISSLYRDAVPHLAVWLDRAVKLAATAGESAVTRHTRAAERELQKQGLPPERARALAQARVYSTAPGTYGTRVGRLVVEGNDNAGSVSRAYLEGMSRVYGDGVWGEAVPGGLRTQLRGNQAVLFSRSSNLYGASDTHDVYETFGALGLASKAVNGAAPDMVIENLRQSGQACQETLRAFLLAELQARQWNPRWIREMQRSGYAGARQFTKQTEALAGLTTTAPDSVDPSVWNKMFQVYVRDEYGLGIEKFFSESNPAARQQQLARFLEVERRGVLRLDAADRALLAAAFVRSVAAGGAACSALVCGNRALGRYAASVARSSGGAAARDLALFSQALRAAATPPAPPPGTGAGKPGGAPASPPAVSNRRMRIFTAGLSPEEWQRRFAAAGTLAVDPRSWAALAALYAVCFAGVTATKRREARLGRLTELRLSTAEDCDRNAHC